MEDLKIEEDNERQVILLTTPKRKERIKLFVPMNGTCHWKITYENGSSIPELKGSYLSRKLAIEAVVNWLRKEKPSKRAKQEAWFGPDEKKTLRTKSATRT